MSGRFPVTDCDASGRAYSGASAAADAHRRVNFHEAATLGTNG